MTGKGDAVASGHTSLLLPEPRGSAHPFSTRFKLQGKCIIFSLKIYFGMDSLQRHNYPHYFPPLAVPGVLRNVLSFFLSISLSIRVTI